MASLRVEAPTLAIVVASPPGLGAVAIEPQTHAPHGLRRLGEPGGLAMLAPRETPRLGVVFEFQSDPSTPSAAV